MGSWLRSAPVQVNLTVTIVTAAVGGFGAAALAGYGIASRLDYIQIPIIFGLGTAMVTMVGVNIGADQMARARRIAWIGLFSDEPEVLEMGALYLRNVAPVYGAVGLGLALYFASQGANRVLFPVLAGTVRMVIAAFVGWSAVIWYGADLTTLYQIVALAPLPMVVSQQQPCSVAPGGGVPRTAQKTRTDRCRCPIALTKYIAPVNEHANLVVVRLWTRSDLEC